MFMPAFDHLIIFSKNPEAHASTFRSVHGLQAVPGGEHSQWGTYNYLAFMKNNSYIEWLGIRDHTPAQQSDNPLIQQTVYAEQQGIEGPIQFALRVANMDDYIEHFQKSDIPYQGPFPGQRTRKDGSLLEWRMLFPEFEIGHTPLPFLIEWNGEGNLPESKEQLNSVPFTEIQIFTESPTDYADQLETIYRLSPKEDGFFNLENGRIDVQQGDGMVAKFDSIHFQSQ